jgi:hypothetical protein
MPENFCFDDLIRNFMVFIEPEAQSYKNSRNLKMFKNFQFFCDIAEIRGRQTDLKKPDRLEEFQKLDQIDLIGLRSFKNLIGLRSFKNLIGLDRITKSRSNPIKFNPIRYDSGRNTILTTLTPDKICLI